jgi:ribosomal protein S17
MIKSDKMPKTYTISKEEAAKIKAIRRTVTDKRIDKRFREPPARRFARRG